MSQLRLSVIAEITIDIDKVPERLINSRPVRTLDGLQVDILRYNENVPNGEESIGHGKIIGVER